MKPAKQYQEPFIKVCMTNPQDEGIHFPPLNGIPNSVYETKQASSTIEESVLLINP